MTEHSEWRVIAETHLGRVEATFFSQDKALTEVKRWSQNNEVAVVMIDPDGQEFIF